MNTDGAVVGLDDLCDVRQAQARATCDSIAWGIQPDEGAEHPLAVGLVYRPVVRDNHPDTPADTAHSSRMPSYASARTSSTPTLLAWTTRPLTNRLITPTTQQLPGRANVRTRWSTRSV